MKKDYLRSWCDQAWLYVLYAIGIIMLIVLFINWGTWDEAHRVTCILAVLLPIHVFEENTLPGGFYYRNNASVGSAQPLVYPQSMLTNMITNLGAEIVILLLMIPASHWEYSIMTFIVVFVLGQVVSHTRGGVWAYRKYKENGKKTIYDPGLFTSYIGLLELAIYAFWWLLQRPFQLGSFLGGFGIMILIGGGLIGLPFAISTRVKSQRFAFEDAGYFQKFLR